MVESQTVMLHPPGARYAVLFRCPFCGQVLGSASLLTTETHDKIIDARWQLGYVKQTRHDEFGRRIAGINDPEVLEPDGTPVVMRCRRKHITKPILPWKLVQLAQKTVEEDHRSVTLPQRFFE